MLEQAGTARIDGRAHRATILGAGSLEVQAIPVSPALVLSGELDIASADSVREAMAPSLERGGIVLVDLTNLRFMDSSGVHVLLEAAKQLDGKGCLLLHGVHDPVARLFELVGISGVENIHVLACEVDPFLIHV
jgi:anti-sigma B factor antagonist